MRLLFLSVLLTATAALPCSMLDLPHNASSLPENDIAGEGDDTTAPSVVRIDDVELRLVRSPHDGSGFACPEPDRLVVTITASDEHTPIASLRYVAAFGDTAQAAASAAPSLLFQPDEGGHTFSAWLGVDRQRSGEQFRRAQLCFTVAAVDAAANVGERSTPHCLDTTDERNATIEQGSGCSTSPASWLPLLVLLPLGARRRAGSSPSA